MAEIFPFKFEEFIITGEPIPVNVATKIMIHHIIPAVAVREALGLPIWPSLKSCFRPYQWEIKQKRSGDSQHCFGQKKDGTFNEESKGACDWTCKDFPTNKDKLLQALIDNTEYTRLAVYPTFIHGDYAKTRSGSREVFNQAWVTQYKIT